MAAIEGSESTSFININYGDPEPVIFRIYRTYDLPLQVTNLKINETGAERQRSISNEQSGLRLRRKKGNNCKW